MRQIQSIPLEARNFQGQKLKRRSFKQQDLSAANFSRANLQGANFSGANLEGADFSQSKIKGVNFTGAVLKNAKFLNAQAGLENYWDIISIILLFNFSLLLGACSTRIGALLFGLEGHIQSLSTIAGLLATLVIITFLIVAWKQGIATAVGVAVSEIGSFGLIAALTSTVGHPEVARITAVAATDTILTVAVISALLFLYTPIIAVIGMRWFVLAPIAALIEVASIIKFANGDIGKSLRAGGFSAIVVTGLFAVILTIVCIQISRRAFAGDPKNAVMKSFAIAVTATFGTRFREADLTNADFSGANLRDTDFRIKIPKEDTRSPKHDYTQWYQAGGLDFVRWGDSILQDPRVQELLVTRSGRNQFYDDADLQGADLSGFDFYQATLTGANLMGATLQGACLERANLKLVKALNTDFTRAQMTEATIEAWSIDHLTGLEEVDCKFVYLTESSSTGERQKSPASGEFEPGNFTKMFQVTLNTLNLILQDGVVPSALEEALKTIHEQHGKIRLKAIDHRSDGLFVLTVTVPEDADKEAIDQTFRQVYHETVSAIESRYSGQLQQAQQEIAIARRRANKAETNLSKLRETQRKIDQDLGFPAGRYRPTYKSVFLDFGIDDPESEGLTVRALLLSEDNSSNRIKVHGSLPAAPDLFRCYTRWKEVHNSFYDIDQDSPIQNISRQEFNSLAKGVKDELNRWLRADDFRKIYEKLIQRLNPEDQIHLFLETENLKLRSLPWHLWDFFESYRKASWGIGMSETQPPSTTSSPNCMRVLAVLGDAHDIDIETDSQKLKNLLPLTVELEFLEQPSRRNFTEYLWDSQGWDILYFSGHGESDEAGDTGVIYLNETEAISFDELPNTLSTAIEQGLKLVIFNCCKGLGLARALEQVYIPNVIFMRQEIADEVAHAFLENLLVALTQGKSIYAAFRFAQEKLEALEDFYPCATWLPILLTNSAVTPFYWGRTSEAVIRGNLA